jgi:hypothetical protein
MEIRTSLKKQANSSNVDGTVFAEVYNKSIDISISTKTDETEINIILTTILDSVRSTAEKGCEFDEYWFDFLCELYDSIKSKDTPSLRETYDNIIVEEGKKNERKN